jgi:hypothetical protein
VVQYATATELAGKLQKDLDTYSADQVLTLASALFSREADTWFAPTTATYTTLGTPCPSIDLPFRPVSAVTDVRINSVAVTGWTLIKRTLWRPQGFGTSCSIPPDKVEIDLTHGEATAPDDVKAEVLEIAGQAYDIPVGALVAESIDDYAVKYATTGGGLQLTASARDLARMYRGTLAA